MLKIKASCRFS